MKSKQGTNSFNDRLRRLGCQQLHKQIKSKQRVKTVTTDSMLEPNKNAITSPPPRQRIQVNNQIDLLQQRLHNSEKEKNQLMQHIYHLNSSFHEIKEQYEYAVKQLASSKKNAQELAQCLERAESELQNFRLMKKMQAISNEITKQQSSPSALKHHKHRRGKFSTAALPSPFGSLKKIQFRNSQLATSDSKLDFSKDSSILRNPFSGYLIQEWQKTKQEKNIKELQISSLQSKISSLKKEVIRQNKEIQSLKSQKPSNHQLVAALQEVRRIDRQYKATILRLRESEKKRKQMSTILKNKGQVLEDQKFYGFSTIADINQMVEKTYTHMQIQSSTIQIVIQVNQKGQQGVQTFGIFEDQKLSSLESLINQLTDKLASKQDEANNHINQIKKSYQGQIMDYQTQIQEYKIRIDELNVMLCKYEDDQGQTTKSHISSQCNILDPNQIQNESLIYQKIKELLEVNEQINFALNNQRKQKEVLYQKNLILSKQKRKQQAGIQVNSTISIIPLSSDCQNCQNCINLIDEIQRLSKLISVLTEERDHYKISYQDHLNGNRQLQINAQEEICRLKTQYQQKQNHLRTIIAQLEEKYHQLERYQLQLAENQCKLNQQTILRQRLQEKLRNIEGKH